VSHHDVGSVAERGGGQGLALGVDDLGSFLPLSLGLAGHGALHAVRQLDVLEFYQGHFHAPVDSADVEDLADVQVRTIGIPLIRLTAGTDVQSPARSAAAAAVGGRAQAGATVGVILILAGVLGMLYRHWPGPAEARPAAQPSAGPAAVCA